MDMPQVWTTDKLRHLKSAVRAFASLAWLHGYNPGVSRSRNFVSENYLPRHSMQNRGTQTHFNRNEITPGLLVTIKDIVEECECY